MDLEKPLTESCRFAKRIPGSIILSLAWNASNYSNGVISSNRVKEPSLPLRVKSYSEQYEDLRILIALKGIGLVVFTHYAGSSSSYLWEVGP